MQLTVLGYAGGFPAPGVPTSGYLLTVNGRHILIDCGSGVLQNLFQLIPVESLDALVLTHLHQDHISDLPVLTYAIDLSRKNGIDCPSLPVFAPKTPERELEHLQSQSEGKLIFASLSDGMQLPLFGATVHFHRMEHPVETYGLVIEEGGRKLALTADTIDTPALGPLLQGADLALMDAGSLERLRKPVMMHLTAAECGNLARAAGVKRLVLTHLLPLIDPQELLAEAQAACPQAELARLMAVYTL